MYHMKGDIQGYQLRHESMICSKRLHSNQCRTRLSLMCLVFEPECPLVLDWGRLVCEGSAEDDCDRLGGYWCLRGLPGRMHSGADRYEDTHAEAPNPGYEKDTTFSSFYS